MDVVWRTGEPVRVRDVIDGLEPGRDPAYTTVMTVMDNLYRKGWLTRERCGRAYFLRRGTQSHGGGYRRRAGSARRR